ncbi:D-serine deaminase-like pyridoxal phosphate-dependent protein [Herbihabitans rhizosphaerae]|uniref:D-serine deaminase-like pyridoxal phosphate-dependent protein n=1 Tax=Herbihabitans rhizosphaerae TaxID=1872711 RepID=A0A4Q7L4X4_9PSEU|nr:amino acid deaminase [Herbihabitans rhizosphaerae]RZS43561.1 D-serine deaminase-like pyridoxal phosphate-dependent protein [Herbihabitans rhizosphaerae]
MEPPARIDLDRVSAIRTERIDWHVKGAPDALFGSTIAEALARKPNLFTDGFVGPLLVLSDDAIEHNLRTMERWCAERGLALAPHGKTTMAPQLFARQIEHGAWAITAATASQVRVYRAFGVSRIMLANQLVDAAALRWLSVELQRDPDFSCYCWVDSVAGVELMTAALEGATRPVDVLVELGADGGRTGARGSAEAIAVAEAAVASPALRLVGVAGYEGALAHDASESSRATVDAYLDGIRELTVSLADRGRFDEVPKVIVSVGGSAYFDQVTRALTTPWPETVPVLPVLRSGAYVTHDDGFYRGISPLGEHPRIVGTPGFQSGMLAWAQVTSRPSDGLALLTAGKRDVPYDEGLPIPRLRRRDGVTTPLDGSTITAVNDQHAFLEPATDVLVGDWIGLGLSHPCTAFDKWQLIPMVGADGETVVDLIRTYF